MEDNASRALLMAAEVLIAMLVVGLGVFLVIRMGTFSRNMNTEMDEQRIAQYNENFYQYSGRVDITAQEIVTMINLAKEQNDAREIEFNGTSSPYYTIVKVVKGSTVESLFIPGTASSIDEDKYKDAKAFNSLIMDFIRENNSSLFSCNAKIKRIQERTDGSGRYDVIVDYPDTDIKLNKLSRVCTEITFTLTDTKNPDVPFNIHTQDMFEVPKQETEI